MNPDEEILALWRETFGEPAPVMAGAELLSHVLVRHLQPAPPYRPRPPEAPAAPKAGYTGPRRT